MKKFEGDEKKGDIIGHFGLGFYSVFMVSENVEIETLSCQEGAEPVPWESKDGMDFAISEGHRTTPARRLSSISPMKRRSSSNSTASAKC